MGSAFYVSGASLSGVQRRDRWEIAQVAIADTQSAARHAIGSPAQGWRARVFLRSVRAGGVELQVWVGVLLRKQAPEAAQ
jgi:hypothetical protein